MNTPIPPVIPARRSFTLLEVLVAIALFAAGVVAIGHTFNMTMRATAASREALRALNYARMEMERMRVLPYGHPELAVGSRNFTNLLYVTTVQVSEPEADRRKFLTVRVGWRTPYTSPGPQPVELQTLIARALR